MCFELQIKKSSSVRSLSFVIALSILIAGCSNKGKQHDHNDETYTCPMHPSVLSDKPGGCPICGMDLVLKMRSDKEGNVTEDILKLTKSPNEVVIASIKTIKAEIKSLAPTIHAQGLVTYDTRNIFTIPARVGGRLEKVYLKYAFQPVKKGQSVAEIYSPELITAQREVLYIIENDPDNTALIQSAKNKLLLLGASESQIQNLIKRKETQNTFTVYSPFSGYLIIDNQASLATASTPKIISPSGGMGGGMGSQSSSLQSTAMQAGSNSLVREGDYVSPGQTLFKIVNNSALRIELDLPASQGGALTVGDEVQLDLGEENQKAKVDFVQPFFNANEDFIKLRIYVKNMQRLNIGQLITATIQIKAIQSLWVPYKSILDLGQERIVFVKANGSFVPKKVITGLHTNDWIEIKEGITTSEDIASNAQFMVDSESFIKPLK